MEIVIKIGKSFLRHFDKWEKSAKFVNMSPIEESKKNLYLASDSP